MINKNKSDLFINLKVMMLRIDVIPHIGVFDSTSTLLLMWQGLAVDHEGGASALNER